MKFISNGGATVLTVLQGIIVWVSMASASNLGPLQEKDIVNVEFVRQELHKLDNSIQNDLRGELSDSDLICWYPVREVSAVFESRIINIYVIAHLDFGMTSEQDEKATSAALLSSSYDLRNLIDRSKRALEAISKPCEKHAKIIEESKVLLEILNTADGSVHYIVDKLESVQQPNGISK